MAEEDHGQFEGEIDTATDILKFPLKMITFRSKLQNSDSKTVIPKQCKQ